MYCFVCFPLSFFLGVWVVEEEISLSLTAFCWFMSYVWVFLREWLH